MSASQVGTFFRTLVQASIDQGSVEPEAHVDVMEVATALGLKPRWNSGEHVLTLR